MSKIIKITPDEKGRAYLKLYGEIIDVTGSADKKGRGEIVAFGETYRFQIEKSTATEQKVEEPTPEASVETEEAKDEN